MKDEHNCSIEVFLWSQNDKKGHDMSKFIRAIYCDLYDYSVRVTLGA